MKDLTRTIEITAKHAEENGEDEDGNPIRPPSADGVSPAAGTAAPGTTPAGFPNEKATAATAEPASEATPSSTAYSPPTASGSGSGTSTPRRGVPTRPMLTHVSHEDQEALDAEAQSQAAKKGKKKSGLSEEQMAELKALEEERKKARQDRVDLLVRKLVDRLSIWTETEKGKDVTHSFNEKTRLETENLKMESFGIDILHSTSPSLLLSWTEDANAISHRRNLHLQRPNLHQIPKNVRHNRLLQPHKRQRHRRQRNLEHHFLGDRSANDHRRNEQALFGRRG